MLKPKTWKTLSVLSFAAWSCTSFTALAAEKMPPVTGAVKSIAQKSKTIAVTGEDKSLKVLKFGSRTTYQNAADSKEIQAGDNITVEYENDGADNLATRITRVIPKLPNGVGEMPLAELEGLLARGEGAGGYFLVDARPAGKYAAGHLPGAHSIPLNALEKEGAKLLPADKGKLLVFYCGGVTCGLSHKSAALARNLGYSRVKVYVDGEPGWKKAEHYTIPSVEYLKTGGVVLIDLRDAKQAAQGRIPGAVNVPAAQLDGCEKKFPLTKSAQIVFYGVKEAELAAAVSSARDWGYTNVTALPDAIKEWQGRGYALEKGVGPKEIVYKKQLGPHEIGSAEFLKGMKSGQFAVIDVRTREEYAKSHIKGALNMPTEEIGKRYSELPAGKPLVLHCSTGSRAEMAYEMIRDKGLQIRYLNATIEFNDDGSYLVGD